MRQFSARQINPGARTVSVATGQGHQRFSQRLGAHALARHIAARLQARGHVPKKMRRQHQNNQTKGRQEQHPDRHRQICCYVKSHHGNAQAALQPGHQNGKNTDARQNNQCQDEMTHIGYSGGR